MKRYATIGILMLLLSGLQLHLYAAPISNSTRFILSPVLGADRNEMQVRGARGETAAQTDIAPEYGLSAILVNSRLVLNNFVFWSDVNDAKVWGNLFFANYYHEENVPLTWNVGTGFLYHRIIPDNTDITVKVPMLKAGPLLRMNSLHLTLNPYVGYAWEQIETSHGDQNNDSWLYGVSLRWHWRMVGASLKYYYQDSQKLDEDYQNFRARLNVFFTEQWGAIIRLDYMEHSSTRDTSILVGPTYVF